MNRNLFVLSAAAFLFMSVAAFSQTFTSGDLVISTVSDSVSGGGADNGLDTAAPIVLDQFQLGTGGTTASAAGSLTLPQTAVGNNSAISGEYGSASEGILQDSVNGQYLTIMGYGVNANDFNTQANNYGTVALGQTTSLASTTGSTAVPRVVALIGADGSVDTSTVLYNVFNTNNPRSVATVDGSSFYISGQGATQGDTTEGVFYTTLGSSTATAVDNTTDTRVVSLINTGTSDALFVSRDVKVGSGANNLTNISTLTNATGGLPTSSAGLVTTHVTPPASPYSSGGNNGSINLNSTAQGNGINDIAGAQTRNGTTVASSSATSRVGSFVYLSPEQYFLASPTVMYVTDSGQPKNGNADKAAEGEGGLQKWVLVSGTWTFAYDLSAGLDLVNNDQANSATNNAPGVTGLLGLAGQVVDSGSDVELFATSYGLNELSQSYLYEITDDLDATSLSDVTSESFNTLYTASPDTSIRGVAFAPVTPVPEPGTWGMAIGGLGVLLAFNHARRRS